MGVEFSSIWGQEDGCFLDSRCSGSSFVGSLIHKVNHPRFVVFREIYPGRK